MSSLLIIRLTEYTVLHKYIWWRVIFKWILRKQMWGCELVSGWGPVANFCDHSNEPSFVFPKRQNFDEQMSGYQFLKNDSAPWSSHYVLVINSKSCFIFWRPWVQISSWRLTIQTGFFAGFLTHSRRVPGYYLNHSSSGVQLSYVWNVGCMS
jgi:hypothetical protein